MDAASLKIALYSHDGMGLGHMRRNTLVAGGLSRSPLNAAVLLVAGARELNGFHLPPGVDCVTLPGFRKVRNGEYAPRHLDVNREALVGLRRNVIFSALRSFRPDVLVVDKTPTGVYDELLPTLELLRRRGTRVVLGLRDILDDPREVQREWKENDHAGVIESYYDAVWIYGDPTVYDLIKECALPPAVTRRAAYTGYLDPWIRHERGEGEGRWTPPAGTRRPKRPYVLCQVGGGEDGGRLAEAFVCSTLPAGMDGVVIQGPYLPEPTRRRLKERSGPGSRMHLLDFVPEPLGLIDGAHRVVTMGGYNSMCEVLGAGKPALVIPRVEPRQEQWIRAERMQRLDLVDCLHPGDLSPDALSDWLASDERPRPPVRDRIDFDGLAHLPRLARSLVPPTPPAARPQGSVRTQGESS